MSAEQSLSNKMSRHIRTILEKHLSTAPLIPTRNRQWASNKFTVNRHAEFRDPSVWSAGLYSNITGARADVIICDDVEVPNTCDTPEKRRQLRERLAETEFILTPGGTMLYIGTPHCHETIYAEEGEDIFLKDYKRFNVPLLNEEGASVWPERFTPRDIELQRRQAGPLKFSAQMMLQPVDVTQSRLDASLLQKYSDTLEVREVQGNLYLSIGGRNIVSCAAWWDPAFGDGNGDSSVLAVVFQDDGGRQYLHHLSYLRAQGGEDGATSQCRQVAHIAREFHMPCVAVETNGLGKFLPGILRNMMTDEKVPCGVREMISSRAKDMRILEAFDAVMAAQALYVHESVYDTPFIKEMRGWRPGTARADDDGLDAVAGALALKPALVKRRYYKQRYSWQSSQHSAVTDFPL